MSVITMIFDQYSRYKACADLTRQAGFAAGDSILDIGSGPECLFGEFMPEATMNYVDPLIPVGKGPRYITGNIFSKELSGKLYDCVTAVDVLEHVPPEHRQAFLSRMSSLSKTTLILGFPDSDTSTAMDTDLAVNRQYQAVFGQEYSWLDEHFRFGLPSVTEVVSQLTELGWHCQLIGHGHSPWLSEMLGFVVCAWDVDVLKKLVIDASESFNIKLYSSDFRAPNYRQFIVASRTPISHIKPPILALSNEESDLHFREIMDHVFTEYFRVSARSLKERDVVQTERDAALKELDSVIRQRDATLSSYEKIINSASWKVTRPLRVVRRFLRTGVSGKETSQFFQVLRNKYHRLPLPAPAKSIIRFAYHRVFRNAIRFLRGVRPRGQPFQAPSIFPRSIVDFSPDYIAWGVVDWHFRHQRPQQLALALAATGRRIFYISPNLVDDKRPGFEVEALDSSAQLFQIKLYAHGAPVIYANPPSAEVIHQLRRSIGEVLEWADIGRSVSLVDHPFWLDVAAVLPNSRLVYDCMDHHEGFGNNAESLFQLEKRLLNEAELTVTTSTWLDEAIALHTKRRALIRNAGDYRHFSQVPYSIYRDPHGCRVIGYYGAIAEWFDLDLVEAVAKQHPDCTVLLIGADTVNARSRLAKLSNVIFTGEVPYSQLPHYLYGFDVCLLPFKVMPLTLATNPVKAYEYLGAGKPIVAVDLPEMAQFDGLVYAAEGKDAFLAAVSKVLSQAEPATLVQQRKVFAEGQNWQHRADALIQVAESSAHDPKVSIMVVTYNNLDFTRACLASLDAHSQYEHMEIIVVDNASSDGTPAFLSEWVGNGQNRKLILNEDNRGFAAANNQGLHVASGEYLVLLNNDTYVTPGWLRTLVRHLQRDKSIGLIGPVTNNIGNEARIDIAYADMDEMLLKSAAYTRRHIGQTYPLRTAAFFCVMMTRTTFSSVGALDEIFGRGFFEDDDYCRRVEQVGLRIACAEDVFIHHHLSASFNKLKQQDRQKLFEDNKKVYEAKWGSWVPHGFRSQISKPLHVLPQREMVPAVFDGQKYVTGHCLVCGNPSRFYYREVALWRESLNCQHCRSTSRYRSIARGLVRAFAELARAEASSLATLPRSSKSKLRVYDTQPPFYYEPCAYPLPDLLKKTGWIDVELSIYKPNKPMGTVLAKGITNQNLECLTYADESLDIVITSDVMEHVRLDDRAHREIYRVLKPGGVYLFTVPHDRSWEKTLTRVQVADPADPSKDVHLLEPEYHGDTNSDGDGGVLAYRTYGCDIEGYLTKLGFEVDYCREDMADLGILNTELYYCRKIA